MKIGLAQMNMIWEDKKINFEKSLLFLEKAREQNVDFLAFPEMSMTGFSMRPEAVGEGETEVTKAEKRKADGSKAGSVKAVTVKAVTALETLSVFQKQARSFGLFIGIGYIEKGSPKSYNRYAIIDPKGQILADYAKLHPFSYGQESLHYQGGERLVTCQVKEFCMAPLICYDLRFPEVFQILSKKARLIVVPANWPKARQEHFELLLRARALENQCYVAGINRTGEGGGLTYGGGSLVADPFGRVIARANGEELLLTADLDLKVCEEYRRDFPVKKDRRENLYVVLSKEDV